MSTKQISVRFAAEGGKQLKAEFQGVGESGKRNLRKISREAEIANAKLARLASRARIAGRIIGVALAVGVAAALRSSLATIDAQAKLAASMRTTTESIQILTRAGDLAGVSMGQVEQATIQLTKRLSQAITGTGPAVAALDSLHLSAQALSELPLDERIATIQDAISKFIPKAEQAATASQIFGDRAGLIFTRIDSATLRQATQDVKDFGLAVSESDAAQIQRTNDALSRMGLLWRGITNQLAVAAAPALEAISNAMAAVGKVTGPVGRAIKGLFSNIGEIATIAATFASVLGGKLVLKLGAAVLGIRKATTALGALKIAIVRTGIGALIIGIGEAIYWFGRLKKGAGGFSQAMELMGNAAEQIFSNMGTVTEIMVNVFSVNVLKMKRIWFQMLDSMSGAYANFVNGSRRVLASIAGALSSTKTAEQILAEMAPEYTSSFSAEVRGLDASIASLNAETNTLESNLWAALPAVREIVAAVTDMGEESGVATEVVKSLNEILADTPVASAAAAEAGAEAGEVVATAWQSARDALANYAAAAEESGAKIGDTITSAFSKAEDMIAKFVETGKFSFKDLANSIIADLTRIVIKKQILGPLAEALDGIFDGGGGGFLSGLFGGGGGAGGAPVPVLHAGGVVGGIGPSRMMPAMAFAGAPRMHNGGFAGLRPDEIPAILQKGERVLSRQDVAAGGAGGGASVVNVTIVAKDVESFRRARTQIAADLAQAVQHGQRGL